MIGWSTGIIKEITQENDVVILLDGMEEEDKLIVPLNSLNIAPYGMYTGGNEWRKELKEGSLIDCMDTINIWYQSTIMEAENREIKGKSVYMVKVGYRRYKEDGLKGDEKKKRYNGWSNKYDDWLNPYSLKIQRPGTIARFGKIACKKLLDEDEHEIIDDTNDILINCIENYNTYAVLRPVKSRSKAIVEIVNTFGEIGGFTNIINNISDQNTSTTYCNISFYHFSFGLSLYGYVSKFAEYFA